MSHILNGIGPCHYCSDGEQTRLVDGRCPTCQAAWENSPHEVGCSWHIGQRCICHVIRAERERQVDARIVDAHQRTYGSSEDDQWAF